MRHAARREPAAHTEHDIFGWKSLQAAPPHVQVPQVLLSRHASTVAVHVASTVHHFSPNFTVGVVSAALTLPLSALQAWLPHVPDWLFAVPDTLVFTVAHFRHPVSFEPHGLEMP